MATLTTYSRPSGGSVLVDWNGSDTLTLTESGISSPITVAAKFRIVGGFGLVSIGSGGDPVALVTPGSGAQLAVRLPLINVDGVTIASVPIQLHLDVSARLRWACHGPSMCLIEGGSFFVASVHSVWGT